MKVDVVIVGGGPAGLSAALVLGRSCRQVLVLDSSEYRNDRSLALHGWLSRDGIAPAELRGLSRAELGQYRVRVVPGVAEAARAVAGGFEVDATVGGRRRTVWGRKLILATGLRDVFPPIPGLEPLLGRGVYVCPYCDAWEVRGERIGVLGDDAAGLALCMRTWSPDVWLFTGGRSVAPAMTKDLDSVKVRVVPNRVRRLVGDGHLQGVELDGAPVVELRAAFVKNTGLVQRSPGLMQQLGLAMTAGNPITDRSGATSVPGVYVAGDASRDLLLASVAAAEGAACGVAVNRALQLERWGLS